jgi:hypothetical protein
MIEPGLLPPSGILFVGGEPKVGKSLLVANLALALAAGKDRAGFNIPAARRVLVCQFELPTPQFVRRLAVMRRAVGAAADLNLLVDTRAGGNLLSAPQGLNHVLNAARQVAAEVNRLRVGWFLKFCPEGAPKGDIQSKRFAQGIHRAPPVVGHGWATSRKASNATWV